MLKSVQHNVVWRERDRATKESKKYKPYSESRKTRRKVRKRAKISRTRREEREIEQGKALVKRRIYSGEQREKEIQIAPENRLKRGHQQREANYKGFEKEEEISHVVWGFSLTLRPRKFKPLFTNRRFILHLACVEF